jgi:hypothetical protein
MKSLFQRQDFSIITPKRIAVAIAILAPSGIAMWASLEALLRLTSGQS